MAESAEELKSLLMKVKEESEKAGLKHNIQKTNIRASGPITSWWIDGKKWQQWQTIFFGFKITVNGDGSHEILGRKAMKNLDSSIKKQRQYFANKGLYSQSFFFFSW